MAETVVPTRYWLAPLMVKCDEGACRENATVALSEGLREIGRFCRAHGDVELARYQDQPWTLNCAYGSEHATAAAAARCSSSTQDQHSGGAEVMEASG